MDVMERERIRISTGIDLAYVTAGDASLPALLLLHGFPSSAKTFRDVIPTLAEVSYVVAPDLPGFGASDPIQRPTFEAFGDAIVELLTHLRVGPRHIYLHDFGAPVGFHVAMKDPDAVLGLIVQNANAHRSGFGPAWADTLDYWSRPNAQNEAAATAHLTYEGTRDQYVAGVPAEVAALVDPQVWEEDWRVMCLPGRLDSQRALIADYGNYAARFDAIARFLGERQPPAVMVWGRHDAFFDISETVSWMKDLPRMESHVLDGGHFLLETHARAAGEIFRRFIEGQRRGMSLPNQPDGAGASSSQRGA
jgi:pimeloyl-ACP methyl ester carboxylesterase